MLTDNLQRSYHPGDDIRNLYVGHFYDIDGLAHTQESDIFLLLRGEILLYDQKDEEGSFRVERLHRPVLFGVQPKPPNPPEQDPIGTLRLSLYQQLSPLDESPNRLARSVPRTGTPTCRPYTRTRRAVCSSKIMVGK